MAKSTRSKVKRAFRAKKRKEGVFAAAEAARLQRLNAKLRVLTTSTTTAEGGKRPEEQEGEQHQDVDMPAEDEDADADAEDTVSPSTEEGVDGKASEKTTGKISTHGPRGSRRERWRISKGMTPRPRSRGLNRQGTTASRYKPGRSHRRR